MLGCLPRIYPRSEKTNLHLWKFSKMVLHTLEISKPKTNTPGNRTWFFLDHPWKFHLLFDRPLEIFLNQPPLFGFFWNKPNATSQWQKKVFFSSRNPYIMWNKKWSVWDCPLYIPGEMMQHASYTVLLFY